MIGQLKEMKLWVWTNLVWATPEWGAQGEGCRVFSFSNIWVTPSFYTGEDMFPV